MPFNVFLIFFFIKSLFWDFYYISSASMSYTLLPGDFVLASKTPGMYNSGQSQRKIKFNDIVIFNGPSFVRKGIDTDLEHPQSSIESEVYTKRIVGLPGDSLSIYRNRILKKEKVFESTPNATYYYYLVFDHQNYDLSAFLEDYKSYLSRVRVGEKHKGVTRMRVMIKGKDLKKVIQIPGVDSLRYLQKKDKLINWDANMLSADWSFDRIPQIYIPKVGDTIIIDSINYHLYRLLPEIKESGKEVVLGGKYLVKKNYFFLKGDNHFYSIDSRFFGLIAEEQIIGKVERVIVSRIPGKRKGGQWRKERFFVLLR